MELKKRPRVAIIDYEMGNLFSVKRACEYAGLEAEVTADASVVMGSDAAILPGVGAFGDAMDNLERLDLTLPIKEFIMRGKPFMGICLGMQMLMSESEEFGRHDGLDVIKGQVVKIRASDTARMIKIPQVGWNRIFRPTSSRESIWYDSPLDSINNEEYMYFVHSYYVIPSDDGVILSVTDYEGTVYCSGILWKNVFACQFHPEKSGVKGLAIYKNWAAAVANRTAKGDHGTKVRS